MPCLCSMYTGWCHCISEIICQFMMRYWYSWGRCCELEIKEYLGQFTHYRNDMHITGNAFQNRHLASDFQHDVFSPNKIIMLKYKNSQIFFTNHLYWKLRIKPSKTVILITTFATSTHGPYMTPTSQCMAHQRRQTSARYESLSTHLYHHCHVT